MPSKARADDCKAWAGRIVSLQGSAERNESAGQTARRVVMNQQLCPGDQLTSGPDSRVSVLLPNQTVVRLDAGTTIAFIPAAPNRPSLIEVLNGLLHILTRTRDALDIRTPVVNAHVKGTELVLRVEAGKTDLWVLEGEVNFKNRHGAIDVEEGQSASAVTHQAPQFRFLIKPRHAVQWAIYYPPLLDSQAMAELAANSTALRTIIRSVRHGRYSEALADLESVSSDSLDPNLLNLRASLRLAVGRVEDAAKDMDFVTREHPRNSTALALKSVVAVGRGLKQDALEYALSAARIDPNSVVPHLALSYAYQAHFDLEKARVNAERATQLAPNSGLAWARLAELNLAEGETELSQEAAEKAVRLEPGLARTQSIMGYAELADVQLDSAEDAFERAINLDSSDPLPRLGKGLVEVRRGNLREGVEQLEIAASLDPTNPVVRNYLGKAYYEQKRDVLVEREFAGAKALDPMDPTAWFYDAIFKQSINRPIEALADLEKATELNGNKAVYRSKFLLDQDAAVRGVNLARIYNEIGFGQRGLFEGFKAVSTAPSEFSSHLLLANSYGLLPRHEVAQASELLQAQLLQPTNISVLPQVLSGFGSLSSKAVTSSSKDKTVPPALLQGAGPSRFSFNEFNPTFLKNGFGLQLDGVGGTQGSFSNSAVISGIHDQYSGSIGQFHSQSDGFRRGDRHNSDLYDFYMQLAITPSLRIQGNVRHGESVVNNRLDSATFSDDFVRNRTVETTGRVGFNYQISPRQTLLGSYAQQSSDSEIIYNLNFNDRFIILTPSLWYGTDLQHCFQFDQVRIIAGVNSTDYSIRSKLTSTPSSTEEVTKHQLYGRAAYTYVPIQFQNATITIGSSYDWAAYFTNIYAEKRLETQKFNPKVGAYWSITPSTSLRAAAFRTLRRPLVANQTLEPTQLAGFNQFFNDPDGTSAWRYGVGIDHRFSSQLFAGAEFSWRDVDRPVPILNEPTQLKTDKVDENFTRAYLYWAPTDRLSLGFEYQYEEFHRRREFEDFPDYDKDLTTHQIPLSMTYYDPSGLFGRISGTHVEQSIRRQTRGDSEQVGEDFWVMDTTIGYRLPNRLGIVSLDAQNLLDEKFQFQDTLDSLASQSTRFSPGRAIFGRINLWFY